MKNMGHIRDKYVHKFTLNGFLFFPGWRVQPDQIFGRDILKQKLGEQVSCCIAGSCNNYSGHYLNKTSLLQIA